MLFAVTHILGELLRPISLLVIVTTLGLLSLHRRIGRVLITLGALGLFALMILPVQQWLLMPLEDRFVRPLPPDHVDGIIVLGGAVDPVISTERGIPSLNAAAERMTEFVALSRRYPAARLLFTGGIGTVMPDVEPEAVAARELFSELGLPPERVIYEDRSRTTYENAVFSRELAQPRPGETWLLVTSAAHMPRSVGVFRHVGWTVIPWPTSYKTVHAVLPSITEPFSGRMGELDTAVHEWVGLVAYRLTGKSDDLFPAPLTVP
jgi:uncharacterized SAM-binding protein YcdF (DUF218 family)